MTKFNAFQFVSGMSIDVNDEFNDLDEMIEGGVQKADEIRRTYNHLTSLLQGMKYAIGYIAEDETRKEVEATITDMENILKEKRAKCASIIWMSKLGKEVKIITNHLADGTKMYELTVDGQPCARNNNLDGIIEYLHANND